MARLRPFHLQLFKNPAALSPWLHVRFFSGSAPSLACQSSQNRYAGPNSTYCRQSEDLKSTPASTASLESSGSLLSAPFWSCRSTWRRAGLNTLRCLAGCTAGDFSALWMLQTYYPELGMNTIMLASSRLTVSYPGRIG